MLYGAACAYGLCATLSLKEVVAAGYDNFDHMQQDSDLTPLCNLPEYQSLLKQRPPKKP